MYKVEVSNVDVIIKPMIKYQKEIIEKLKKLRKKGHSINELVSLFSIPKTSVWYHVHKVVVSPKYINVLRAKYGGSKKRSQQNWINARVLAKKLIKGPQKHLAIAIAMLYWGEGSKKVCEFINSDGKMIQIYLTIIRKGFGIPEKMIKPTMRVFSGMNKGECLQYWSKTTKIAKHRFVIRMNDGSTSRGKTKYGMCRITILKGQFTLKIIHSLIDQIYNTIMTTKMPS